MSIRYTLVLETDGKEVWKRWSGDRDEIIRLAAPALVEMEVAERVAQMFLMSVNSTQPLADNYVGATCYSKDLRSTLWFMARTTGKT